VSLDHRRGAAFAPGEGTEYLRAGWDLDQTLNLYIETAHRLNDLGAVFTWTGHGTSHEGFDAEWRGVEIMTVDGDLLSRAEVFDEGDLDAALAKFDQLSRPTPRLENVASQAYERFRRYFADRDWAAMAELLTADTSVDDHRRVVNAEIRRGRDVEIVNMRAFADVGAKKSTATVIAIRGEHLVLCRTCISGDDEQPGGFRIEMLNIVETTAEKRILARAAYDPDDFEAAICELDARYIAGEAAAHAHFWSVITNAYATLNKQELPPVTSKWVTTDHRLRATFEAADQTAYIRGAWDLTPDLKMYVEAVHRLSNLGAVVTHAAYGSTQQGFDAEWRMIGLLTAGDDNIGRSELFNESDLDTALARFEELQPQARRLDNAASQVAERFWTYFANHEWAAMAEIIADDCCTHDRRRVVNADVLRGRAAHVTNMRAVVEVGFDGLTSTVLATREHRLALIRVHSSARGSAPGEVTAEMLSVVEIDTDNRLAGAVIFDSDDIDAAFEELDARYLAGEAAAHAHAWSVIARTTAAFNRHELPAADWVIIDHRQLAPIDASDLPAAVRAIWDLTPDLSTRIEAVHRLSSSGAVVTNAAHGTSPEGFAAEWRVVDLVTVEGDRISRDEFFDEADLDAALARFDELDRRTPSCENAATRTWARAADAFNGRDVDSFLARMTADGQLEDRRKGLRAIHKGAARRKAVRAVFEEAPVSWRMHAEPIATRGSRLELTRECYCDTNDADRPIVVELLHVMELGDDDLIRDIVSFDPDDRDDAFAELTARWIASGEVAYPELIEVVDRINAAINRHDWEAVATHFASAEYVDHRQLAHAVDGTIADWLSSLQTTGSRVPNFWVELAEVLARSAIGIVGRMALKGTSTDGASIEIPFVVLTLLHGERVTRLEAFDEDQRDLALVRLQEFNRPV
jgi:hypothetical protein